MQKRDLDRSNTGKSNESGRMFRSVHSILTLGNLIADLSNLYDRHNFTEKPTDADPETLKQEIIRLTSQLQYHISCNSLFTPIRHLLGYGNNLMPHSGYVQVLALVSYLEMVSPHHDDVDTLSLKAGILFSENDRVTGVMHCRQIIGHLLAKKTLILERSHVTVNSRIRKWLAGGNEYAAFGLVEDEVKAIRKQQPNSVEETEKRNHEHYHNVRKSLEKRVKDIPWLSPQEIFNEIGNQGYIGQNNARRAISLSAYRHVTRLKRLFVEGLNPKELPSRENALLIGGTGTGKSFLIKTLFENIFKLPTAIVDATSITECGFVGGDVTVLLTKLMEAANGDKAIAQLGVSCLDEADKIASMSVSNSGFSGGLGNDVSRGGVQRGLLKIMEEDSVVDIPSQNGKPINRGSISFSTSNVQFLLCGAFTGMDLMTKAKPAMGFGEKHSVEQQQHDINRLTKYGLARELVGRFGSIINFDPLSPSQLMTILERNTITRYARELELGGIQLIIADDVKQQIVKQAIARDTGARGLATELLAILNDACYHAYSSPRPVNKVRLNMDDSGVKWDITYRHKAKGKAA